MFNETSPLLLKNQAGDVLNFGNTIVQSIYMSYESEWNRSEEENKVIILNAAEDFLESKGFDVNF